ncbi:MAG: EthD domain-containing protein [Proteobacteria bacterium]|nr:EthD domain-containing protein [Pseudomonadota bacterium]
MPKLIALIKALPGMNRQAFIEHYETCHAPLVRRLLPMIGDYRRSYVTDHFGQPDNPLGYDVMTELWFANDQDLAAFYTVIRQQEVLAQIRADEAHFLISDATRMIAVEEHGAAS